MLSKKKKLRNIGYAFLVEMSDCLINQKIQYLEDLWCQLFPIIEVLLYKFLYLFYFILDWPHLQQLYIDIGKLTSLV